jgi:TldD protein
VDNGILIYGNGSWSGDQRANFSSAARRFEISKAKSMPAARRGVSSATVSGTPVLGGQATYEINGAANDGKGEPTQANAVSHGCPIARFRQINVLNTAAKKA